jgi:hypothetical protein
MSLMMEAASTSETSVCFYETTRPSIPEGCHIQICLLFLHNVLMSVGIFLPILLPLLQNVCLFVEIHTFPTTLVTRRSDRVVWIIMNLSSGMYCRVKYRRPTFQRYVLTPSSGPDDGSSTHLWNGGRQLFYTAVHLRRQIWTLYSPPWELEISQFFHCSKPCNYYNTWDLNIG